MQKQGGSKDIRTPPDYNRGVRTPTTSPCSCGPTPFPSLGRKNDSRKLLLVQNVSAHMCFKDNVKLTKERNTKKSKEYNFNKRCNSLTYNL